MRTYKKQVTVVQGCPLFQDLVAKMREVSDTIAAVLASRFCLGLGFRVRVFVFAGF